MRFTQNNFMVIVISFKGIQLGLKVKDQVTLAIPGLLFSASRIYRPIK